MQFFGIFKKQRCAGAAFGGRALCAAVLLAHAPAFAACNEAEILKCYAGEEMGAVIKDIATLAEKRGKRVFGEEFKVINRIRYSKYGKSLGGDWDAVLPGEKIVWQMGMSKWRHRKEISRQDMRYGAVYRFADAEAWHGGMLGLWGFLQHDALQKHARTAFGGEYEGKYGRAGLAYYAPLSGWQQGRAGYREKALGGGDINMRLNLGRKWSLNARMSYWDSAYLLGVRKAGGNLRMDYAPRSWLKWSGAWRLRSGRDLLSLHARIKMPLGGGKTKRYRKRRA
ncbi:MAG: hypothetical protein HAW59_03445, partial [Betaproteobacteria bacterium]|nr:hypothetical protein [Betaproteobacteria bacterium]